MATDTLYRQTFAELADEADHECVECGYKIYWNVQEGCWLHNMTDAYECYAEGDPLRRVATFDPCGMCGTAH